LNFFNYLTRFANSESNFWIFVHVYHR